MYAQAQVVDRLDPVRMRTVELLLTPSSTVLADCQAHGRIVLRGESLIAVARRGTESKMGTLNAKPEGLSLGHDLERSLLPPR